ncbi:hypothetical protein FJ251_13685 [bacterium]|nr:hypothetical protein [bacterium]
MSALRPRARRQALPLLVALLCACAGPAAAESPGGSFRLWPASARELAMADAATLLAPGLESLGSQPASLVGIDRWEAGLGLQRPQELTGLGLASLAFGAATGRRLPGPGERTPTSRQAVALGFQQLGAELADGSGWGEWTAALGLAWSPQRWLSVGARGDYSRGGSEDGRDEGSARALALGLRAVALHPALEFGWVASDVHQRFAWDAAPEQQRRRASSQTFALAARLPGALSAELQGRWRFRSLERAALGLEWQPLGPTLALRGGLLVHRRVETSWSPAFGAGFARGALRLDYGFRFERAEGPGSQHRLSLRWIGDGR